MSCGTQCAKAFTLISGALPTVDNDERLLKIKGRIALFIQTMDVGLPSTYLPLAFTDSCLELAILSYLTEFANVDDIPPIC